MKVAIVQVPYPQPGEALKTLQWQIDLLNNWEEKSVDLIIFPENANCTGYTDKANMLELINNQGKLFEQAMAENSVCCIYFRGVILATLKIMIEEGVNDRLRLLLYRNRIRNSLSHFTNPPHQNRLDHPAGVPRDLVMQPVG